MSDCTCNDIIIEMPPEGADGVGIASIALIGESGVEKTYRISYTNGTHFDYVVSDGSSIASIAKTGTQVLVDTYTVTLTNGDTTTFQVTNGRSVVSITKTGTDLLTDTYTVSYNDNTTSTFQVVNGNGIVSIAKTGTDVLVDTYTITMSNNTTVTYQVVNGRGITSITKTGTVDLVDSYRILFNDGTYTDYTVTNGAKGDTGTGIVSITKTSSVDLVDTYTILLSNSDTYDFTVTNGKDGKDGEDGDPGEAATIAVGTVTTLPAGSDATVTNSGTSSAAVFNFGIPQGQSGESAWGQLTGNISDQTDLQQALDNKADVIISSASGDIASFSDGADGMPVSALSLSVEPVQDLHGYDNPWPAGGGANQINPQDFSTWATISGDVITFDGSLASTYANSIKVPFTASSGDVLTIIVISANSTVYYVRPKFFSGNTQVYDSGNYESTPRTKNVTLSADVDSFSLGVKTSTSANVLEGAIKVAVIRGTATDWTPYSNICPISGHTSATVTRTGKNLLAKGVKYYSDIQDTLAECFFVKAGTYTISFGSVSNATSWRMGVRMKDTNGNDLSDSRYNPRTYYSWVSAAHEWRAGANSTATSLTFTFIVDCYVRFTISSGDTSSSTVVNNAMLNEGSTSLSYEAPHIQTVTISLGQTVYGATLDVLAGTMKVDRVMVTYNGTEDGWGWLADYNQASINLPSTAKYGANDITWMCNALTPHTNSSRPSNIGNYSSLISSGSKSAFSSPDCDTLDKFKTWVGTNNIQFCYELATPLTVQLTANQMQTLLGQNNIWADTGDIAVTYRADTKLYIDQKIAEATRKTREMMTTVTDSMVAPKNLTAGEIVIVGDDLYKATANIASGATLTVGTNVAKITLAEYIQSLL